MDGELDLWEGEYTYRCILTNDYDSSTRDIDVYKRQALYPLAGYGHIHCMLDNDEAGDRF